MDVKTKKIREVTVSLNGDEADALRDLCSLIVDNERFRGVESRLWDLAASLRDRIDEGV